MLCNIVSVLVSLLGTRMHFPMYEWGYGAHVLFTVAQWYSVHTINTLHGKKNKKKQRKVQGMLRGR